jgi:hypothetical protein
MSITMKQDTLDSCVSNVASLKSKIAAMQETNAARLQEEYQRLLSGLAHSSGIDNIGDTLGSPLLPQVGAALSEVVGVIVVSTLFSRRARGGAGRVHGSDPLLHGDRCGCARRISSTPRCRVTSAKPRRSSSCWARWCTSSSRSSPTRRRPRRRPRTTSCSRSRARWAGRPRPCSSARSGSARCCARSRWAMLPRARPTHYFVTRTGIIETNPSQNGRIQCGNARSPGP